MIWVAIVIASIFCLYTGYSIGLYVGYQQEYQRWLDFQCGISTVDYHETK